MKYIFGILFLIMITNCGRKKTTPTTLENSKEKVQKTKMDNINFRFDSLTNLEADQYVINNEKIEAIKKGGVPFKYEFKNTQDLFSEFSTDEIFLPFHIGLLDEEELFNILIDLPQENWKRVIFYLQRFALPTLINKKKLLDLVNENTEARLKLETVSLIEATLYHLDKKHLLELIDRLFLLDEDKFLYGENGRTKLIDQITYRYAYENIDDKALLLLSKIIDRHNNHNYQFRTVSFNHDPLNYFLFSNSHCQKSYTYIYENSTQKIRADIDKQLLIKDEKCIPSKSDLTRVDDFIKSAKSYGLTNISLTNFDKLYLLYDFICENEAYSNLMILEFSNFGIPFTELNSTLNPPVHITAHIYTHFLNEFINKISFPIYEGKQYLIIIDKNNLKWGFDISEIKYTYSPDNKLTDVFNRFLQDQKTEKRLISLGAAGKESLFLGNPSNVIPLILKNKIDLLKGWNFFKEN